MFEAIIFDWDGTLADSRQIVLASFRKALDDVNCKVSDKFIERLIGVGSTETFREILRATDACFDKVRIKNLVKKKAQEEIKMSSSVKLLPGALELLETLQGKIKLGLASMNNRVVVNHMLKTKNLDKFFNVVITADEIAKPKPNPEIFLKCATKLRSEPHNCLVVEDSIFGVEAAKTAKMACIAVLTGVYSKKELEEAKPDLIIGSLTEKRDIVNFVFRQNR